MKLGIISDTHGSVAAWREALAGPFQDVQEIFHAGDLLYHGARNPLPAGYNPKELALQLNQCNLPIFAAGGNCDSEVDQMVLEIAIQAPYFLAERPQGRILVTHGHYYGEELILNMARKFKIKIWISGHTHIPRLEKIGDLIFLNPGSPSLPKEGEPRSVATIERQRIQLIDLDSKRAYRDLKF